LNLSERRNALSKGISVAIIGAIIIISAFAALTIINPRNTSSSSSTNTASGSNLKSSKLTTSSNDNSASTNQDSTTSTSSSSSSRTTSSEDSITSSSPTNSGQQYESLEPNATLFYTPSDSTVHGLTTFYAKGLIWAFFVETNYTVYDNASTFFSTSPNGVNWSEPAKVNSNSSIISYKGGYLYVVYGADTTVCYCNPSNSSSIYFRRGVLTPSGTIQWSTPGYQAAYTAQVSQNETVTIWPTSISIDSLGHPWILLDEFVAPTSRCPSISPAWCDSIYKLLLKSSTNDSGFTMQNGFPINLGGAIIANGGGYIPSVGVQQLQSTNGTVALIECPNVTIWNGDNWIKNAAVLPACGEILNNGMIYYILYANETCNYRTCNYIAYGNYELDYNYKTNQTTQYLIESNSSYLAPQSITFDGNAIYFISIGSDSQSFQIWNRPLSGSAWSIQSEFKTSLYIDQIATTLLDNGSKIGMLIEEGGVLNYFLYRVPSTSMSLSVIQTIELFNNQIEYFVVSFGMPCLLVLFLKPVRFSQTGSEKQFTSNLEKQI
jgi:hypothetical protein